MLKMLLHFYSFFLRYHYRLLSGPESTSVFEKDSAWHISEDLDIQAMKVKSVAVLYLFADVKFCCCFTDGVSSSESMQHTCWPSWFQFISSSWMSGDIYFLTIVNHQVSEVQEVHKEVYCRQRHIFISLSWCLGLLVLGLYLALRPCCRDISPFHCNHIDKPNGLIRIQCCEVHFLKFSFTSYFFNNAIYVCLFLVASQKDK